MVVMMNLLDTDGDGTVTKTEFGVYYKRLKDCDNAAFEAVWKEIDTNGDGNLTLNELCDYYGVDQGEAASALKKFKKEMTDEKVVEALQLQSLLNEEQQRQGQRKRRPRLRRPRPRPRPGPGPGPQGQPCRCCSRGGRLLRRQRMVGRLAARSRPRGR